MTFAFQVLRSSVALNPAVPLAFAKRPVPPMTVMTPVSELRLLGLPLTLRRIDPPRGWKVTLPVTDLSLRRSRAVTAPGKVPVALPLKLSMPSLLLNRVSLALAFSLTVFAADAAGATPSAAAAASIAII
ncbi:hypothetical protein VSS74_03890 [Conexibacter stalactiti]|uniref:Secreted protein n=1 Tax=Conexibacter stalactiti TaxID=1940611 RepID=A0ABU4HN40_9ACTN|nr:hypothetical protein [Conexibacter stalactiti]MDW5593464.1 hypothetical protein [Conexibacter stalactiti]MEC5034105.1 hypothetical protein [Conexibacter stalactiti]